MRRRVDEADGVGRKLGKGSKSKGKRRKGWNVERVLGRGIAVPAVARCRVTGKRGMLVTLMVLGTWAENQVPDLPDRER